MKKIAAAVLAVIFVFLPVLVSCGNAAEETAETTDETTHERLKDASGKYYLSDLGEAVIDDENIKTSYTVNDDRRVFYEIFVGSFSDSDGDGTGDIRGIINRFDYLNDGDDNSGLSLGVEGIWLTPIFSSPSYHKYDVTDYYTVDPAFGTEDDLRELIALCHERRVKIIIDLPINHTGRYNQMFVNFTAAHLNGDTENKYYDYYCYYTQGDGAPAGRAFSQLAGTSDYYECNFSGDMPELNFDNDDVRSEVLNIAKYYLDMGIDGFRFDAAKYIYFGDNAACVEFWQWYMSKLREINPDIYTVAEVWDGDGVTDKYFSALDCFNFTLSQSSGLIAETAKAGNVNKYTAYVENYLSKIDEIRGGAIMKQFITNHDMDRAAGFLTPASGYMQMAANLYILSPGSPFIYYGEEIGMRGSRGGASTDANRRLAMLWGDGDAVKNPTGTTYGSSSQTNGTVEEQKGNGDSLYNYYKKLIMIRKANPEIARGEYKALPFADTKLGGYTSTYDGNTVCVLHNTSKSAVTYDLSEVTDVVFEKISAVIGTGGATLDGTTVTIDAQTSVILR